MDIDQEKRMAGDYEIIHALHIGDREIVLGENPSAPEDERYVCAFCQQHEIFANYTEVMVSDDYPELVKPRHCPLLHRAVFRAEGAA